MEKILSYRDLRVWQNAYQLSLDVYDLTDQFPSDERFALSQQLRRAGVGVPSSIAEGFGRHTTRDYLHFLHVARGSLYEVQTQLSIALDRGYFSEQIYPQTMNTTERELNALISSLRKRL